MRYATIRKKHLQAERLWAQLMAQPNGFIAPDKSDSLLIAAQAWDEGSEAGYNECSTEEYPEYYRPSTNPYRSAP